VPLKSRCSKKCDAPASWSDSSREPEPTQYATATERTSAMVSVTRRMPLGNTDVSINGDANDHGAGVDPRRCCYVLPPLRPRDRGRPARRPVRPRRRPRMTVRRWRRPARRLPGGRCGSGRPGRGRPGRGRPGHGHRALPHPRRSRTPRRVPRRATARPCPAGRCRRPGPRPADPTSGRPRRC
jgi:hypothetical protein